MAEPQTKIVIDVDDEFSEMPGMDVSDDESEPVIAGPKLEVPETLQDLVNKAMDDALDLGLAVNDYLQNVGANVPIDMDIEEEIETERNNLPTAFVQDKEFEAKWWHRRRVVLYAAQATRLGQASARKTAALTRDTRVAVATGRPHIAGSVKATGECGLGHPLKPEPQNALPAAAVGGVLEKVQRVQPAVANSVVHDTVGLTPGLGRLMKSAQVMDGAPQQVINLFSPVEILNTMNAAIEPEFVEVEFTLDTGATVHAADRIDFPLHLVQESAGSKAGQRFQAAGGKLIDNEGEINVVMVAPGFEGEELLSCFQIAKVTRPLLSVTKMTESGKLSVVCKKEEALVLGEQGQTLARFKNNCGLYTCLMKVRNPRFQHFHRQAS